MAFSTVTPGLYSICLASVVILFLVEHSSNLVQARVVRSATLDKFKRYSLLGLPDDSNTDIEREFAEVKYVTQLRHRRDLTERNFHIIQLHRPNKPPLELHLVKKDFIFSDFKFVVTYDDHVMEMQGNESMSQCQFSGTIPEDPVGMAALSTCSHHAGGFSGMIITSEGHFIIEPHSEHGPHIEGTVTTTHVMVRLNGDGTFAGEDPEERPHSDVLEVPHDDFEKARQELEDRYNLTKEGTSSNDSEESEAEEEVESNNMVISDGIEANDNTGFNVDTLAVKKTKKKDRKGTKKATTVKPAAAAVDSSGGNKYVVEIAVFCDKSLLDKFKNKDRCPSGKHTDCLKEYVMTIVHAMDMCYQQPSLADETGKCPLAYRLVYLEIQDNEPLKTHKGDSSNYLKSFCDYAAGKNTYVELWDHALMLTGMDITSDGSSAVIGVAWAGTMCTKYYSCSLSEGTSFSLVLTITHEIGHSVGMDHDGDKSLTSGSCDGGKYIMSPYTGAGKVTWSTCSRKNLADFLKTGSNNPSRRGAKPLCLEIPSKLSDTIKYATNELPGQKYDADAQCLPFGTGYKHVASRASSMCSMLYCSSGMRSVQAQPALDGTTCSPGKKCNVGKCV